MWWFTGAICSIVGHHDDYEVQIDSQSLIATHGKYTCNRNVCLIPNKHWLPIRCRCRCRCRHRHWIVFLSSALCMATTLTSNLPSFIFHTMRHSQFIYCIYIHFIYFIDFDLRNDQQVIQWNVEGWAVRALRVKSVQYDEDSEMVAYITLNYRWSAIVMLVVKRIGKTIKLMSAAAENGCLLLSGNGCITGWSFYNCI